MNGPAPVLVELAELLVDMVPHADWCLFGKNGTDATTTCVTVARAATGRRKVLVAAGAYHGAVPWCSPSVAGVTAEDRAHLLAFTYNDHRKPRARRGAGWQRSGGDPGLARSGMIWASARSCRRPSSPSARPQRWRTRPAPR